MVLFETWSLDLPVRLAWAVRHLRAHIGGALIIIIYHHCCAIPPAVPLFRGARHRERGQPSHLFPPAVGRAKHSQRVQQVSVVTSFTSHPRACHVPCHCTAPG